MTTREKLAKELENALGEELVSIAEYGPSSSEDGQVPSILVVLAAVSSDNLALMRKPIENAHKNDAVGIMTLTENELKRSADVFPIKFRAISQNGKTLHGKNLISDMEIVDSHLRLRCEQELKNLSLRLRQKYIQGARTADLKASLLTSASNTFRQNLVVLAELKEGKTNASREELANIAEGWELDLSPLEKVRKLTADKKPDDSEAESTYHDFRDMVDHAADIADKL
jgi:hypothetical protein